MKNVKHEYLEGKTILLISLPNYSNGIIKEMKKLGAEVIYIHDKPNEKFLCKTFGRMQFEFYQRVLERYYKKRIQEYCDKKIDYVLVIRGEYTPKKTVQYLRKMFPETKLILYMWDGLNKRNTFGIEKKWNLYDKVYTFDRIDYEANKDKINFLPLYYYDEYLPQNIKSANDENLKYDISFIGTEHDDRIKIVKNIMNQGKQLGLKCFYYFYIPHKFVYLINKFFNNNFKGVKESDINYNTLPFENLYEVYANSKCVVDVENKGQHGLTMRTIEILGLHRKLITTNQDIVNYDFYDTNNILIVDRKNPIIDGEFLKIPYKELSDEIYIKYSIKNWILEVLS